MIPLRDDNPTFSKPVVTVAIMVINICAWVFVQGAGAPAPLTESICQLGLIPGELLQSIEQGTRIQMAPQVFCELGAPAWHTTISSMFMHGSWFHIIGNMWFLWIFGNNVEDAMGHGRFATFYILCGLAAAGLQIAADPGSPVPMVGASGAIGGILGAYIMFYPKVHVHMLLVLGFYITTIAVPAILMLGYWFAVQLLGGYASLGSHGGGVAFWAHIGGFVAGALLCLAFRKRELLDKHPYAGWNPQRAPTKNWRRVR